MEASIHTTVLNEHDQECSAIITLKERSIRVSLFEPDTGQPDGPDIRKIGNESLPEVTPQELIDMLFFRARPIWHRCECKNTLEIGS